MDSKKTYFAMIAVLVLLISGLLAIVVVGNSYLQQQGQKLSTAKLEQKSLNEQQLALIKAKQDLEDYKDLHSVTKSIVPQDKDQAKAVREIVRLADESGASLASITFDDSTLGRSSTTPAPDQSGSNEPTEPSPQAPAPSAPPVTQAQPVPGIPGVYSLPISIVSTKDANQFNNLIAFLTKLENNRRTALVKEVNITTSQVNGQEFINFTLTVNIFVKP